MTELCEGFRRSFGAGRPQPSPSALPSPVRGRHHPGKAEYRAGFYLVKELCEQFWGRPLDAVILDGSEDAGFDLLLAPGIRDLVATVGDVEGVRDAVRASGRTGHDDLQTEV